MERDFIKRLEIREYGCVRNTSIELTPLHALIGPNDTGKSTILRALRTMTLLASGRPEALRNVEGSQLADAFLQGEPPRRTCLTAVTDKGTWNVEALDRRPNFEHYVIDPDEAVGVRAQLTFQDGSRITSALGDVGVLDGSHLLRLDGDSLRQPSGLIPSGKRVALTDTRGAGLAGLLDAIRDRGDGGFEQIRDALVQLFPTVRYLQLQPVTSGSKVVQIELVDGTRVKAEQISEGMLYFLAFAAIAKAEPAAFLLIEEPENGLHPARIADVMRILREVSKTMQVVLATHSPLVLNELLPEEVTVLTRTAEAGTIATPIKDTPNFEQRSEAYALGELWLSYANGSDEAPLLNGGPRP